MQGRQLYFYHSITKIATTVFGSLFSNIYVAKNDELVAVPIMYGGISKHLVLNTNDGSRNMVDRQLPAMSFTIKSFAYDSVRKIAPGGKIKICCDDPETGEKAYIVGSAVPWLIGFELRIKTKTLDEGFQITEQILPYFSPTLSVNVQDLEEIMGDCKYSRCDITLNSFDHSNVFEGSFEEKRELEWTMSFSMSVPYWGFASGYPGVIAAGMGSAGTPIMNPIVNIGSEEFCATEPQLSSYIKHIFTNYMVPPGEGKITDKDINSPGIPESPQFEDFLEQTNVEGHVATIRTDSIDDTTSETKGKDYPS